MKRKMKKRHYCLLLLLAWSVFRVSAQEQVPDTAAYGNLRIYTEPLEALIEIPSLNVNYPKVDEAASIAFIPPAKYFVRVSAKKKVLEYEVEVKSNTESHQLFDLKKQKVTLLNDLQIVPEPARKTNDADDVFTLVEVQPGFLGGEEERIKFLRANMHYPETAKDNWIQGKVFVSFIVEKDGSLSDVMILKGIGGGCDEEAVRVVKKMPRWIPGTQRGEAVRVRFILPIKFTLTEQAK
jgi:TonB family protein